MLAESESTLLLVLVSPVSPVMGVFPGIEDRGSRTEDRGPRTGREDILGLNYSLILSNSFSNRSKSNEVC